jgi:hypothetical protein
LFPLMYNVTYRYNKNPLEIRRFSKGEPKRCFFDCSGPLVAKNLIQIVDDFTQVFLSQFAAAPLHPKLFHKLCFIIQEKIVSLPIRIAVAHVFSVSHDNVSLLG